MDVIILQEPTFTSEHTKQARSPRKSFGIVSKDIVGFIFQVLRLLNLDMSKTPP